MPIGRKHPVKSSCEPIFEFPFLLPGFLEDTCSFHNVASDSGEKSTFAKLVREKGTFQPPLVPPTPKGVGHNAIVPEQE
jgi:hypothetical protein